MFREGGLLILGYKVSSPPHFLLYLVVNYVTPLLVPLEWDRDLDTVSGLVRGEHLCVKAKFPQKMFPKEFRFTNQ